MCRRVHFLSFALRWRRVVSCPVACIATLGTRPLALVLALAFALAFALALAGLVARSLVGAFATPGASQRVVQHVQIVVVDFGFRLALQGLTIDNWGEEQPKKCVRVCQKTVLHFSHSADKHTDNTNDTQKHAKEHHKTTTAPVSTFSYGPAQNRGPST